MNLMAAALAREGQHVRAAAWGHRPSADSTGISEGYDAAVVTRRESEQLLREALGAAKFERAYTGEPIRFAGRASG